MTNLELLIRAWIRCDDDEKKHFRKMLQEMWLEYRFRKERIPVLLRYEVWARDKHTCHYCGGNYRLEIDHKLAESRGGKSDLENLVTACHKCNAEKGTTDYEAFKKLKGKS